MKGAESVTHKLQLPKLFRLFFYVGLGLVIFGCGSQKSKSSEGVGQPVSGAVKTAGGTTTITALCGNGLREGLEQCDGGLCCDRDCRFLPPAVMCDPVTGTKCSGSTDGCATNSLPDGVKYFNPAKGVAP